MEFVQRHDRVAYDGSNSAAVLEFFSAVNGSIATWSIDSEASGLLTLRCELAGPDGPSMTFVEASEGDVFTKVTDQAGNAAYQGPWPLEEFAKSFSTAPTVEEFNALSEQVQTLAAALESTTQEEA